MAGTNKNRSTLDTNFANNTTKAITAELLRDFLWSAQLISSGGDMILPNTSGVGIKVDETTPVFGWKDLVGNVGVRQGGGTVPLFNSYLAGIYQYQIMDNGDEVFFEFHIPHDYVPNTDMFIHTHWSTILSAGGNATWEFVVLYANGYNQGAFNTTSATLTVTSAASPTPYQHLISEIQFTSASPSTTRIDRSKIEIDGLILVRVKCTTLPNRQPFLHYVDLHYQSTQLATKGRNIPFYT